MSFDKLKDKLLEMVGDGLMSEPEAEQLDENLAVVNEIVEMSSEALKDGLQWDDLRVLGKVIGKLYKVADGLEEKTGPEKSRFVESAIWLTYRRYDPNIPWIPESIETWLEEKLIRNLARVAIEGIYSVLHDED